MKKLIFMTESMVAAGGVVRVITNWSNYFIAKRPVKIVSARKGKPYFFLKNGIEYEVENFEFDKKILGLVKNILKMYFFLKKNRGTIIVINKSLYIEPVYVLRKLGLFKDIKLIYFAHGGNSDFENFYMRRFLTRHRVRMIFNSFDNVICLYKDIEDSKLPKVVKSEKISYISNPIVFSPDDEKDYLKENIVLFCGRVEKEKGTDTLIKSWKKIENKFENWRLVIVGDGKDKEEFIELSRMLEVKNIEFFSSTSSPEEYYKKSKIFVLPSLFEGMPMAVLEAKYYHNIVIGSKITGISRLIKEKVDGYLFEIGNVDELAEKVEFAILEIDKYTKVDENPVIQNAIKSVKKYKIESIAKLWGDILE